MSVVQQHPPTDEAPKTPQRLRGVSFKRDYLIPAPAPSLIDRVKAKFTGVRLRPPSMVHDVGRSLIPPKDPAYAERITVVLDLDETIVYAREGPLYVRPYTNELMRLLKERFEGVVWTAGVRAYAQAVVKNIDTCDGIKHCVYRHKKWFTGTAGYNKDLSLLGRDIETTIIFENTPDCVRGFESNGVIVADYEGGESPDETIAGIICILRDLLERRQREGITVPQYLQSSRFLTQQDVVTDIGGHIRCYCLETNETSNFAASKDKRVNRDLSPSQQQRGTTVSAAAATAGMGGKPDQSGRVPLIVPSADGGQRQTTTATDGSRVTTVSFNLVI